MSTDTDTDPNEAQGLSTKLKIGIFFLPFIFAWFTLKKGVSTQAKVISFVWLLVYLGAGGGSQSENPAKQSASNSSPREKVEILEVTPSSLFSAYENNEIKADNTYKNRYVKMTGRIDDIGKDLFDNIYVTFSASDFFGIQVYFNDEDADAVSGLNKGSTITVVCKVEGLMGNVMCKDSALM
tara:strand:+ start:24 stop:569 length:546 start_codon:yes stop_codon:yes gene_type:complete